MPQNFFITGMPKAGKTTLLRRLIDELKAKGLRVGGFISPEEKRHGTRTAFYVEDIQSGKRKVLASVEGDGPKVSKYHVNVKSFESVALPVMKGIDSLDVIIIDEIGRMEMKSMKFSDLLDRVFEHETPVIAALHRDFVDRYSVEGEILMLTPTSREAVFLSLVKRASAYTRRPKKAARKRRAAKKKAKKKAAKKKPAKRKASGKAKKKKREKAPEEKPRRRRGIVNHFREFLGF